LPTLLTAYNAFSNPTTGETGLMGGCSSDNPVTVYTGMITATTLTDPVKMLLMHHSRHVQQELEE